MNTCVNILKLIAKNRARGRQWQAAACVRKSPTVACSQKKVKMLGTKEHDELLRRFETAYAHLRLDKESRELWGKGQIYQNGETNALFKAFELGYAVGKCAERLNLFD